MEWWRIGELQYGKGGHTSRFRRYTPPLLPHLFPQSPPIHNTPPRRRGRLFAPENERGLRKLAERAEERMERLRRTMRNPPVRTEGSNEASYVCFRK